MKINSIGYNFYSPLKGKAQTKNLSGTAVCEKPVKKDFPYNDAYYVSNISFRSQKDKTKKISSKDLFLKFCEQANNYTEQDIEEVYNCIAAKLKAQKVQASPEEIKYTMELLTRYAKPKAIVDLTWRAVNTSDSNILNTDEPSLS
ncbi:hypothetical protein II906_09290, partial [bacterium]|nr:hypothetical protein [bacterium]